jgi:prophage regulatory protein
MSLEHNPARAGLRILRRQLVLDMLQISASTLYNWIAQGKFPAPIEAGPNTRAWLAHEIDEHLLQRAKERDEQRAARPQRRAELSPESTDA